MPEPFPLARSVGITLAVGLIGAATSGVADAAGWDFPSVGHSICDIAWKLGTLAVIVLVLRHYDGRRFDLWSAAFDRARDLPPSDVWRRTPRAVLGLLGCAALAVITSKIGTAAGDASAYDGARTASLAVLAVELLLRYPLTVFAEEALFRGVLYDRVGRWAPVVTGLLFAGHHLQQVSTIPSLIPIGIGLGVLRWWTGSARTSLVVHYLANAVFLVTTYG
jgi:membrane protease YdiL (CAAX protease family)